MKTPSENQEQTEEPQSMLFQECRHDLEPIQEEQQEQQEDASVASPEQTNTPKGIRRLSAWSLLLFVSVVATGSLALLSKNRTVHFSNASSSRVHRVMRGHQSNTTTTTTITKKTDSQEIIDAMKLLQAEQKAHDAAGQLHHLHETHQNSAIHPPQELVDAVHLLTAEKKAHAIAEQEQMSEELELLKQVEKRQNHHFRHHYTPDKTKDNETNEKTTPTPRMQTKIARREKQTRRKKNRQERRLRHVQTYYQRQRQRRNVQELGSGSAVQISIPEEEQMGVPEQETSTTTTTTPPPNKNERGIIKRNKPTRFNVHVPSFQPNVLQPYTKCSHLRRDIEIALMELADSIIQSNAENKCYYYLRRGRPLAAESMAREPMKTAQTRAGGTGTGAQDKSTGTGTTGGAGLGQDANSYGTNNQVDGVDEADAVKSDGEFVFAAYGTEVVMLNLDGEEVARVEVPQPELDDDEDEEDRNDYLEEPGFGIGIGIKRSYAPAYRRQPPVRNVESLLLDAENQRIVAITHTSSPYYFRRAPTIVGGGETIAYIFSYHQDNGLTLINQAPTTGRYSSARSIGSNIHMITSASINTYVFTSQLHKCTQEYAGMTQKEYERAAYQKAKSVIRQTATDIMMGLDLLSEDGNQNSVSACRRIVQISNLADVGEGEKAEDDADDEETLDLRSGAGILQSFTHILSFDVSQVKNANAVSEADVDADVRVQVNTAGAFTPTSTGEVYASNEWIIVAGRGYRREKEATHHSYSEYTFLMSFHIPNNGIQVTQQSVGEVKGYLLNQYSMDVYQENEIRIATTTSAKWGPVKVDGKVSVRWARITESSSQVTKLRLATDSDQMQFIGQRGDLGVTERIFAARFLGNRAYVVTFLQKDPLYVIDLEPDQPEVLGQLDIPGFSNYLHPIGENSEYLLSVGQDADPNNGRAQGLKISLFDVSDPSQPTELAKYIEQGGYSTSSAQWDFHAFRYIPSKNVWPGILIIPMSNYRYNSKDNFDGFAFYKVKNVENGVEPVRRVAHAKYRKINGIRDFCFSQASLPPRSMVFNGRLMTFKGHSVKMTKGGVSGEKNAWNLNLDENRKDQDLPCYDYFRPFF